MCANVPEWEPGRRGTVETLLSGFAPPFPASGRRNVGALPRNVSSCQTGVWDDGRRHARHSKISSRAGRSLPTSLEPAAGGLYNSRIEISPRGKPPEPIVRE